MKHEGLGPPNMGEINPENEGNVGSHGCLGWKYNDHCITPLIRGPITYNPSLPQSKAMFFGAP